MLSLVALPLRRLDGPGGAAGDPQPRARGLLRGRQDEDRDDPAGAAAGRAAVGDHRHMLGIGHVIGDTAIIVAAARRHPDVPGRRHVPLLGDAARHRRTLTSYIFDNAPDRRPQPAQQGLRGGVRAAADRARAERRRRRVRAPREGAAMELSTPPPVRRLTGRRGTVTAAAAAPRSRRPVNGNGAPRQRHRRGLVGFVGAARPARATVPTIDRMQVEQVSIAYGSKLAVKSVSLPIRQGEVLALIGPSGCGKTTLLRSLNRLTELTKTASLTGRITLDGIDITTLEPTALRRRVTMVFQQPNPFPMSVFDNVAYVLREQAKRRPRRKALRRRSRRTGARGPARRGRRQPRPPGAAALRRPAAAPVHRPRAGRAARGPVARRAVLGARSPARPR